MTASDRALVSGNGFLGRHIVARLVEAGWDVAVATRRSGVTVPDARVLVVSDRGRLAEGLRHVRPDLVVNAAGETWRADDGLMAAANAAFPERVALAMRDARSAATLVHLGSSLEYAGLPPPTATDEHRIVTRPADGTHDRSAGVARQVADTGLAARTLAWSVTRELSDTLRWIWQFADSHRRLS